MAKFKFYLEAPKEDSEETVLDYDNETSELRFANGDIVVPQSEYRDWKPFFKMDEGKRQLKTIKIQLGLKCNYSCEYCSQRFVPRNSDDTYAHQDESEKTKHEHARKKHVKLRKTMYIKEKHRKTQENKGK